MRHLVRTANLCIHLVSHQLSFLLFDFISFGIKKNTNKQINRIVEDDVKMGERRSSATNKHLNTRRKVYRSMYTTLQSNNLPTHAPLFVHLYCSTMPFLFFSFPQKCNQFCTFSNHINYK